MTAGISVTVAAGKGVGEGVGTMMAIGPQAGNPATSRAAIKIEGLIRLGRECTFYFPSGRNALASIRVILPRTSGITSVARHPLRGRPAAAPPG